MFFVSNPNGIGEALAPCPYQAAPAGLFPTRMAWFVLTETWARFDP